MKNSVVVIRILIVVLIFFSCSENKNTKNIEDVKGTSMNQSEIDKGIKETNDKIENTKRDIEDVKVRMGGDSALNNIKTHKLESNNIKIENNADKEVEQVQEKGDNNTSTFNDEGEYLVKAGDNLYSIAKKVYNSSRLWVVIYLTNSAKISNPDLIYIGQKLRIDPIDDEEKVVEEALVKLANIRYISGLEDESYIENN